jgi:hypothetical protein
MKSTRLSVASLISVAVLATGCASAPSAYPVTATAVTPDRRQLDAEIAQARAQKRAAVSKEQEAWKAVVPYVVMARYVSAKSGAETADKQLAKLEAEFTRQGCARHDL